MFALKDKKYETVIGYGVGQYYEKTKKELERIVKLDFLCDRKWDNSNAKEYDGIPILQRDTLTDIKEALLIVFIGSPWVYDEEMKKDFETIGIDYIHVDELLGEAAFLSGALLKEKFAEGVYKDNRGNTIYFDLSIPEKVRITFLGRNNVLKIGRNITVGDLYIRFGNNGRCSIGDNTEIIGAEFYIADAKVEIGQDCLFSTQVILRTHDAHHIFDRDTHRRINYAKDIRIGDNVWIAFRCTLLGGARIGMGSVVGTNTVTSGEFGDHKIIVGVPGRVIKENICWSRDNTEYFNREIIEECVSQEMLKYM